MSVRSRNTHRGRCQVCAVLILATVTIAGAKSSWALKPPPSGPFTRIVRATARFDVSSPQTAAIVGAMATLQRRKKEAVEPVTGSGQLVGSLVRIEVRGAGLLEAYVQGRSDTGGLGRPEHLKLTFGIDAPDSSNRRAASVSLGDFHWATRTNRATRDLATFTIDSAAPRNRRAYATKEHVSTASLLASLDGLTPSDPRAGDRAFQAFRSRLVATGRHAESQFVESLLRVADSTLRRPRRAKSH